MMTAKLAQPFRENYISPIIVWSDSKKKYAAHRAYFKRLVKFS